MWSQGPCTVKKGPKRGHKGAKRVIEVNKKEEVVKFYLPAEPTFLPWTTRIPYLTKITSSPSWIILGEPRTMLAYSTLAEHLKTTA